MLFCSLKIILDDLTFLNYFFKYLGVQISIQNTDMDPEDRRIRIRIQKEIEFGSRRPSNLDPDSEGHRIWIWIQKAVKYRIWIQYVV